MCDGRGVRAPFAKPQLKFHRPIAWRGLRTENAKSKRHPLLAKESVRANVGGKLVNTG